MSFNYLTAIIFLPVIGAVLIAFIPGLSARVIKRIAAIFTLISLGLAIFLFCQFDSSLGAAGIIQFEEKLLWIPAINAYYHLGVDGLSLPLVVLTAFLGLPWRDALLEHTGHARERGVINTPSYHQVTQPVYRSARFRWHRYREQMAPVMPVLAPWIERFGYES